MTKTRSTSNDERGESKGNKEASTKHCSHKKINLSLDILTIFKVNQNSLANSSTDATFGISS